MKLKFKRGFSLVELLVVIAIIGILAAVGITAYSGYTANAKIKASDAQYSKVTALVNAEFARCAAGEGTFSWGGNCFDTPVASNIVDFFALPANDLKNPYTEDQQSVRLCYDEYGTDSSCATIEIFTNGEDQTKPGAMHIFCSNALSDNADGMDTDGGRGCQIKHNNGSDGHQAAGGQNMVTIAAY